MPERRMAFSNQLTCPPSFKENGLGVRLPELNQTVAAALAIEAYSGAIFYDAIFF